MANHTPEQMLQNLNKTNEDLQNTINLYKTLGEQALAQADVIVPLMREYLHAIKDIRTQMGQEVLHILEHGKQLTAMNKMTPDLEKLVTNIFKLRESLNPETMELLDRIVNGGFDKNNGNSNS